MCGIYGFVGKIKPGKESKVLQLMKALAIESEIRGIDATGFFSIGNKAILMEKNAVPAEQFIEESKNFTNSIIKGDPHIWVGHNRMASVGKVNTKSSHPFMGEKHLLVHNGTCHEVKDLLTKKIKKKMKSKTDSEGILHLIEANGMEQTLKQINAYSIVIANMETDQVWFARDYKRPLVVYDMRRQYGIRVFCSTKEIGEAAIKTLRLIYKAIPVFSTKPYHLYTANYKDGEFKNEGRYHTPPAADPETTTIYHDPNTITYPDPTMADAQVIAPARRITPRKLWNKYFGPTKKEVMESNGNKDIISKAMAVYGD